MGEDTKQGFKRSSRRKTPRVIAHRGNTNGPSLSLENNLGYLLAAIGSGFDVEVDVRYDGGKLSLGHDSSKSEIDHDALPKERAWFHCKDLLTLDHLLSTGYNCFMHDQDAGSLTAHGSIWTFPREPLFPNSIAVMPEKSAYTKRQLLGCGGICTDVGEFYKSYFEDESEEDEFTLLVQGPLDKASISNLDRYRRFGRVILSYWDGDDESLLEGASLDGVELVKTAAVHESVSQFIDKRVYQWCSTLSGLRAVRTTYCMKLRSDEYYEDLAPVIDRLRRDPAKLVCSNVFFKRWSDAPTARPFHISDHIMAGRTSTFLSGMSCLFEHLENGKLQMDGKHFKSFPCEAIFASFYLKGALGPGLSLDRLHSPSNDDLSREIFRKHFDVIDVNELGDYQIVWNSGKKVFNKNYRYDPANVGPQDLQVRKMEDVFDDSQ